MAAQQLAGRGWPAVGQMDGDGRAGTKTVRRGARCGRATDGQNDVGAIPPATAFLQASILCTLFVVTMSGSADGNVYPSAFEVCYALNQTAPHYHRACFCKSSDSRSCGVAM